MLNCSSAPSSPRVTGRVPSLNGIAPKEVEQRCDGDDDDDARALKVGVLVVIPNPSTD